MKAYFEYEDDSFWAIRTNGCECITAEGSRVFQFLPEKMLDMKSEEEEVLFGLKMKKIEFPDPETAEQEATKMIEEKRINAVEQDADFWYKKIDFCGNLIFFVPDEYKTEELCALAGMREIEYKIDGYLPIHEDIMREGWCIGGPLLKLSILSYIPVPKQWKRRRDPEYKEPSPEEIINNKLLFLKENMEKIKKTIPEIEIIENEERINKEFQLLCESKIGFLDIKIYITVGYKRKGRLMINLTGKSIIEFKFMYEDEKYKYRNKVKKLYNKMFMLLNGFCGTIGLESNPGDIFKIDELLIQMGDGELYGIEDVKWNMKIKWRSN